MLILHSSLFHVWSDYCVDYKILNKHLSKSYRYYIELCNYYSNYIAIIHKYLSWFGLTLISCIACTHWTSIGFNVVIYKMLAWHKHSFQFLSRLKCWFLYIVELNSMPLVGCLSDACRRVFESPWLSEICWLSSG